MSEQITAEERRFRALKRKAEGIYHRYMMDAFFAWSDVELYHDHNPQLCAELTAQAKAYEDAAFWIQGLLDIQMPKKVSPYQRHQPAQPESDGGGDHAFMQGDLWKHSLNDSPDGAPE